MHVSFDTDYSIWQHFCFAKTKFSSQLSLLCHLSLAFGSFLVLAPDLYMIHVTLMLVI